MLPLSYSPNNHFMNMTDSLGEFLSLNDSLAPDNYTHNLTFNTVGQSSLTLEQNYTMKWIYVSIYFGTASQIIINTTLVNAFTLSSTSHTSPYLSLNLNISTFRELRLYNYALTALELNISGRVQADPLKDNIQYYYMFLCNQSQRYFYDSMNPSINSAQLSINTTWQANTASEFIVCPQGYISTTTFYNNPQELATCVSN